MHSAQHHSGQALGSANMSITVHMPRLVNLGNWSCFERIFFFFFYGGGGVVGDHFVRNELIDFSIFGTKR